MYHLNVAEAVESPQLRNTYELEVEYMHGDADHYSTRVYHPPYKEQALTFVTFLVKWNELDHNYKCDLSDSYYKLQEVLTEFGIPKPDQFIDRYFEQDATCVDCGRFAWFDSVTIYWYDNHGTKYRVTVLDDNDQEVKL